MLMGHFPHGTSARSLNHLGQLIKTGEFREYDYKKKKNIEKYGAPKPPFVPLEDISKSKVPVAIFAGMNDTVVPVEGMRTLMEIFVQQVDKSPLVGYTEIPDVDHMSFLLGKDLSYFDKVLDYVDLYNKNDAAGR
jgi:lysosomal acid lipase/cholesteryl ester hydrolase